MARTLITPVTAAVLIAACTAAACSKHGDSQPSKAPPSAAAPQATLVSATAPAAPSDGEGFEPAVVPAAGGPVAYADGETAYHDRKYGEAAAIFARYTAQKPRNAWGHYMLGLSAWKSGDPATAEKAFNAALDLDPDHAKSLVNLSRVLIEQKRFGEAIETLRHAADITPDSVDVQRLLGRVYGEEGQLDEAAAAYRQAIALNARDAWSMNNLGLLFLEARRADEALPLLREAVQLRTDVAAFHNNLGMALEHTGQFGQAASAYRDALAADAGHAKARANLARVEAVKVDDEKTSVERVDHR